jgi:hypothetical protein
MGKQNRNRPVLITTISPYTVEIIKDLRNNFHIPASKAIDKSIGFYHRRLKRRIR